ncbi:hypothetical protein KQI65_12465 [bacterium]|nr:hypothetical protein [bacterium]
MGTQQLLLIVLGIIVVGIGVSIGFTIFDANADQANRDAITEDCLHLAAAAQGFYHKPAVLGGGGRSFENISIADCGMADTDDAQTGRNLNATYAVAGAGDRFTITASSSVGDEKTVTLICDMSQPEPNRLDVQYANW